MALEAAAPQDIYRGQGPKGDSAATRLDQVPGPTWLGLRSVRGQGNVGQLTVQTLFNGGSQD